MNIKPAISYNSGTLNALLQLLAFAGDAFLASAVVISKAARPIVGPRSLRASRGGSEIGVSESGITRPNAGAIDGAHDASP